jgi:hypothetical protein
MTRKKVRHIPTEAELVDKFGSQAIRDMLVENWPGKKRPKHADVEAFARDALADARVYIRDAVKPAPKQVPVTDEPLMTPIQEATIAFTQHLQITYVDRTGRMPPFTATRRWRGPFAKILLHYLKLLGASTDDIRWINEGQRRSNKMTDKRGQERRKRKKREPIPE